MLKYIPDLIRMCIEWWRGDYRPNNSGDIGGCIEGCSDKTEATGLDSLTILYTPPYDDVEAWVRWENKILGYGI